MLHLLEWTSGLTDCLAALPGRHADADAAGGFLGVVVAAAEIQIRRADVAVAGVMLS
jgi:hypothetical protein